LVFSAGADVDRMAERRSGFLNNNGVTGGLQRNEDDMVSNTDFYAQAEWRIAPRWSLLAGLRHSRVDFESRDYFINGLNPDDSGSLRYARTTPVAGVTWRMTPAANVYANWGKGFETPTFAELAYRPGGATGLNFALQPADSVHRELGLKMLVGETGRINASVFRVDVSNEIVVNSSSGGRTDFRNATRTEREGMELLWEGRIAQGFTMLMAYTRLNARFAQSFTSGTGTVNAGNRLPGVPASTLYGELVWRHAASGFHAALEGRHNAKVYTDDQNSEAASGYTIWNVRAGFEQRSGSWRFSEFLRMDNVDNRAYIGSVIVAEANRRFYEPAPGRSVMIGAQATLQFR
jgi:iron complex outermembrane receptor protein